MLTAYHPYQPWAALPPLSKHDRKNTIASRSYSPGGQLSETNEFNFLASKCGFSSSMRICVVEDDISSMRSDLILFMIFICPSIEVSRLMVFIGWHGFVLFWKLCLITFLVQSKLRVQLSVLSENMTGCGEWRDSSMLPAQTLRNTVQSLSIIFVGDDF